MTEPSTNQGVLTGTSIRTWVFVSVLITLVATVALLTYVMVGAEAGPPAS